MAKALCLVQVTITKYTDSRYCEILQYMEGIYWIDMIEQTLRCVCVRWCTDDNVDHNLGWDTSGLQRGHLGVRECFEMERLQTMQGSVKEFRANHVIIPYTESLPWPLQLLHVNIFYKNPYSCLLAYNLSFLNGSLYNRTANRIYRKGELDLFSKLY